MPPKGKKGSGSGDKGRGAEEEVEEPLQAVILADSFETRFAPFTLERPRCLLPLANTPLIEYTFEFLANAGVEDVYVYCGAHIEQMEEYIDRSKWSSKTSPFASLQILRSTSRSIGDAMRDLDKRGVLTGDFLVVYGDIVSNLPLETALAAHRERRQKDKNSIMTMVLREAGTNHRTKSHGTAPVFVIDPSKQRCLHYEQMRAGDESHKIMLDPEILTENDELEIRQDLIDCGIDICTPDVLALWSDNFDYEVPRRGFLHSVLKDYELNGKKIHTHIVNDHYAARVKNLRAYDAVTRDVISRWAYPIAPDSNLMRDQTYRLTKGLSYREEAVVLAGSCILGGRTVVGRATAIGDKSVITNSVIGRRCIIGRNVRINGAYLWDDVSIGDGAVIEDAIIANEVSIGKRCTIKSGALVSYGVAISDDTTVSETSRITRRKRKRGLDGDDLEYGDTDTTLVGKSGEGFTHTDSDEEDDEEHHSIGPASLYKLSHLSLSQDSISTIHSHDDSTASLTHTSQHIRTTSMGSITSDEGADNRDFHHEAVAQLYESLQKGDASDNIQLELSSLRMTANVNQHQVRRAVVTAFMKHITALIDSGSSVPQAVTKTIPPHATLLRRTMFDYGEKFDEKIDQVDFLLLAQADLAKRKDGEKIIVHASNALYINDVLEQEGFEQWWEDERSQGDGESEKIRASMETFMDALLKEESSEEEDEDDSDDE